MERLSVHLPCTLLPYCPYNSRKYLRDQGQRGARNADRASSPRRGARWPQPTTGHVGRRRAPLWRCATNLRRPIRDLFDECASISLVTDEIEKVRRDADGNAQRFESSRHHLEELASELAQTCEAR